jgi:hypothetical protein
MRHPTVTAFALVLLLCAPGAFRELCADGGAAPAAARVVKLGDARLAVTLDRTRVQPGERVQVAMSIENPGARERVTEVEIAVLERAGSPMARVMPPPTVRHSETVTMVAKARGTTQQTVALSVPAARGPARGLGRTFMVRVSAKGAASPATIAVVAVPAERAAPTRAATAQANRPAPPRTASNANRTAL